jgi:hypothetical protein
MMGLSLRLSSTNHARLIAFKRPGETWDEAVSRLTAILEVVREHADGGGQTVHLDGLVDIGNEGDWVETTIREAIASD